MDQRYVNLNNPVEEEKEEPDNDEEEARDSFKSDSDFQEETDPEEGSQGYSKRNKSALNHDTGPRVEDVDDLVEDVAARLRRSTQEDIPQLQ